MPSRHSMNDDTLQVGREDATRMLRRDTQGTAHSTPIDIPEPYILEPYIPEPYMPEPLDATLASDDTGLGIIPEDDELDKTIVRPYPEQVVSAEPVYDPRIQPDVVDNPYDAYEPEMDAVEPRGQGRSGSSLALVLLLVALAVVLGLGFLALSGRLGLPSFSSGDSSSQRQEATQSTEQTQEQTDQPVAYEEYTDETATDDVDIPEFDENDNLVDETGATEVQEQPSTDTTAIDDGTYDTTQEDAGAAAVTDTDEAVDYGGDQALEDQTYDTGVDEMQDFSSEEEQ